MIPSPFIVHEPVDEIAPIIISSPHSGTLFPVDLKPRIQASCLCWPMDTDWHINRLYDFVTSMGITLIEARYSRYVIDLNRHPDNSNLYDDDRIQSALLPVKTFDGKAIYIKGQEPSQREVQQRLALYYWPYYQQIKKMIDNLKQTYKHILVFDAHSIRHRIAAISDQPFPNLILSDDHQQTASDKLINQALAVIHEQKLYSVSHNTPFRGGHLTRYFGRYQPGVHALQLEMCQSNYMNEITLDFEQEKALLVQKILQTLFSKLKTTLIEMK